jgi:hypothetical protein
MSVAEKIIALLDTMPVASLDQLNPVRRQQFAQMCRHWAEIAERPKAGVTLMPQQRQARPVGGVLADLEGRQQHE